MRWIKAREEKICSACQGLVQSMERYYGGPYQLFCKDCGEKYCKGDLKYSHLDKSYIDIALKKECSYEDCENLAENTIHGRRVCDEHIGSVMNDQI